MDLYWLGAVGLLFAGSLLLIRLFTHLRGEE
jgi:hypothetical protein